MSALATDARPTVGTPLPTAANSSVTTLAWLVLAGISTLLFSLPIIYMIAAGADYLPGFHESLAYRYFFNIRILDGQGGAVWLPQGQILSAIQNAIVAALHYGAGIALTDLRRMLWWYGVATNLMVSALYAAVMIAACLAGRLSWTDRALILSVGPFTVLTTKFGGFYYRLQPDYVSLDLVFIVAAAFFTLMQLRDPRLYRQRDGVLAGIFTGIAAANKVILVGPAGLVVLAAATRRPADLRAILTRSACAAAAAIVSFGFAFWICYLGNVGHASEAISSWLTFLAGAGTETGKFWEEKFQLYFLSHNYHVAFVLWVAASLALASVIACRGAWQSRASVILIGNLLVGMLLVMALLKRGAGSTFFEVASALIGLAATCAAVAFGPRPRLFVPAVVLGSLAIFALTQFQYWTNWSIATRWREISNTIWEIHRYLADQKRPVIVVMPDKRYAWNSVEELIDIGVGISGKWIFLGSRQTPLAEISQTSSSYIDRDAPAPPIVRARRMLNRLAPGFDFRTTLGALPPGALVMWAERWDPASDQPVRGIDPREAALWRPLTALLARSDSGCRTWEVGFSREMRVHACFAP